MNKGSIVERLCSDLIAKSRDINRLLYFNLGKKGDVSKHGRDRGCRTQEKSFDIFCHLNTMHERDRQTNRRTEQ